GITTMVRALADACELPLVHEVLDSTEGFARLDQGSWAFSGRDGTKLWEQLATTIAGRWDEVVDALDAVVLVPEVNEAAVTRARRELSGAAGPAPAAAPARSRDEGRTPEPGAAASEPGSKSGTESDTESGGAPSPAAAFWERVGIDPILISLDGGEHYTLRCYLGDRPVFLGSAGRIRTLPSATALARHLAGPDAADGHDLARAGTWPEILAAAGERALAVEVDPQNVYRLAGLGEDLAAGPLEVDPGQLDLGVELLLDVGEWAGDDSASVALSSSQSLGWLTTFILRPDPSRLAPSPPFDAEADRWNSLVGKLTARLSRP
ncbi:MAG TPA: primosomal protein, partial [Pseudonocardia sp.]